MQLALPENGSVLGVDIGYSPKKRSSAACRLDWTDHDIRWTIERFRAVEPERSDTLARVVDRDILAAAFDGPLRRGFDEIGRYRASERMLTRRLQPHIGKPGQSSAPVGRKLNEAANVCARLVMDGGKLLKAAHPQKIDDLAAVEAFPSSFLGLLIEHPTEVTAQRSNRSDSFFLHLAATGTLEKLLERFLPGRHCSFSIATIKDHDDRAAFVCALTALCIATMDYVAVGDDDGWIILPPRALICDWAWQLLKQNAAGGKNLVWVTTD